MTRRRLTVRAMTLGRSTAQRSFRRRRSRRRSLNGSSHALMHRDNGSGRSRRASSLPGRGIAPRITIRTIYASTQTDTPAITCASSCLPALLQKSFPRRLLCVTHAAHGEHRGYSRRLASQLFTAKQCLPFKRKSKRDAVAGARVTPAFEDYSELVTTTCVVQERMDAHAVEQNR